MIEIGPGPGAATDWLRHQVARLVAVECDQSAADALADKFVGSNVEIVCGDGADLGFAAACFDSAGCFTMLHHVPTVALQDAVLGQMLRVLRPGGILVGSDSLPSEDLERFHEGDIYNPIQPGTLGQRLRRLGFEQITVHADTTLRFTAYKQGT
jgi:SAM-dependent methyltransferase